MSGTRTKLLRRLFFAAHMRPPTRREWELWKRMAANHKRKRPVMAPAKIVSIATAGKKRAARTFRR